MAQMIPSELAHVQNTTIGEKKVFRAVNAKTPKNWICYTKRKITNGNEPDFLLIGPDIGIIVLEEKGISIDMIQEANPESWLVVRDSSKSKEVNPERQARGYTLQAVDLLKKVAKLRNNNGKLKFTYGHGVVLSNITRNQFENTSLFSEPLSNSFTENLVICKDELPKINQDGKYFTEKIKKIVDYFKFDSLTEEDVETIRFAIFKESRVRYIGDWLNDKNAEISSLTVEQEQLATGIGKNDKIPHRLIRGVVGSGKTIVLRARAIDVAKQNPNWKVLLTFFTRSFQGYMEKNMPDNVEVISIDRLFYKLWKQSHLSDFSFDPKNIYTYKTMIDSFNSGDLPKGIYNAIFLDEAQDITPEKADCLFALLDKNTNCAMFAGDGIQNIFSSKIKSWKDHGFQFHGRSSKKDFCINYRNTKEIYEYASKFIKNVVNNGNDNSDEIASFVKSYYNKISFKRTGPCIYLKKFNTQKEECISIVQEILRLIQEQNVNYGNIAILHPYATDSEPSYKYIEYYLDEFSKMKVPFFWISKNKSNKLNYDPDLNNVVISTPASAKGLEWDVVFTPSINRYPKDDEKLAFVATTRARNLLYPSEALA